jgi:hypothetical protein
MYQLSVNHFRFLPMSYISNTCHLPMTMTLIVSFPPDFIFGRDEFNRAWAFEHLVILDVVLNTVTELKYFQYLTDLKSMFCTASAAVKCALQECSGGGFLRKDFGVS